MHYEVRIFSKQIIYKETMRIFFADFRANNALNRDLLQWKSSIDKSEYDRKHIENIEISYECFKKIPEFKYFHFFQYRN